MEAVRRLWWRLVLHPTSVDDANPPNPFVSSHSLDNAVSKSEQVSLSNAITLGILQKFTYPTKKERAGKGDPARSKVMRRRRELERHHEVRADGVLVANKRSIVPRERRAVRPVMAVFHADEGVRVHDELIDESQVLGRLTEA